jgi:phosphocarrier protein HPr
MATHTTLSKDFVIRNEYGIHARPAALLVRCASRFQSEVDITKDGITVSGKSIMGLLTLEGFQGCTITLSVTGPDAKEALAALAELIDTNFGE